MINTPIKTLGDYTIQEIDTFNPEQTQNVPMDRQFTPVTNVNKASFAELWSTITTTWATETRTWTETGSLMTNSAHKNLGSYTFDEIGTFSTDQIGDVSFTRQFTPVRNTNKPSPA